MPAIQPILIIIADDSPGDRLLAVTALRKGGIDNPVLEVEDGQQLLDLLRSDAPKGRRVVVFLDINMPRMNGIEALAELKGDPALRRVPVVMLTTSEADIDLIRAYDLGANSYLSKPVSFAEFLPKMQQLGAYWTRLVTVPVVPDG
ncbi:MAG: response regulator [Nevskia sp.]|nr:response regulator [Nevskia sp.]